MLDTMVIPDRGETRRKGETKWMCTLPSAGSYAVTLSLGDAEYKSSYEGTVNGVPFQTRQLAAGKFHRLRVCFPVVEKGGLCLLELAGSWPLLPCIAALQVEQLPHDAVLTVAPAATAASSSPTACTDSPQGFDAMRLQHLFTVDFGPGPEPASPDYLLDKGDAFQQHDQDAAPETKGSGFFPSYGWSHDNTDGARRRGKERNAMLDTMVIPDRGETRRKGETKWMCTLPSAGMYLCTICVGDAEHPGSYSGTVNSVQFSSTPRELKRMQFQDISVEMQITETNQTLEIVGSWPQLSSMNAVHVHRVRSKPTKSAGKNCAPGGEKDSEEEPPSEELPSYDEAVSREDGAC
jgi:hypothetical protein